MPKWGVASSKLTSQGAFSCILPSPFKLFSRFLIQSYLFWAGSLPKTGRILQKGIGLLDICKPKPASNTCSDMPWSNIDMGTRRGGWVGGDANTFPAFASHWNLFGPGGGGNSRTGAANSARDAHFGAVSVDLFQDKNLMSTGLYCAGIPGYACCIWRESKVAGLCVYNILY